VTAAADAKLYWFWPERARFDTLLSDEGVWRSYRLAANRAGLHLDIISVDDVGVVARPDGPAVYLRGERVDPQRAVFHGKLYTWPMFAADVWRSLATFQGIAEAGYCTLLRPELNLISNDKAATLLHLRGVDPAWLPTLSVPTRGLEQLRVRPEDVGISYPVVVKPASWGSGKGVVVARTEQDLMTTLRLAGAAELTMVVQPLVGGTPAGAGGSGPPGPQDVRVYCVEGRPVGALRRTPSQGSAVANVTAGGTGELVDVPADLAARAAAVAAHLDTPWLGVDFLGEGDTYWLSEVEIDACIGPVTSRLPGMDAVLGRRFEAYRGRLDRWLATGGPGAAPGDSAFTPLVALDVATAGAPS
jgi:hypothetical protein